MQILKAINNFALTVLETSRQNILTSEEVPLGYYSSVETALTKEQYDEITAELRKVAARLVEYKQKNNLENGAHPLTNYRATFFFIPLHTSPLSQDTEKG